MAGEDRRKGDGGTMKVRELIGLNMMITDLEITVRKNGSALLDQLNIGPDEGQRPRFPTMVPKEERYINNQSQETKREAYYIDKTINAWDDGKDYWQLLPNRIPGKWLDLEVYGWEVWPASTVCTSSPRRHRTHFHGQKAIITALPSGESLKIKEQKKPKETEEDEQLEGQMSLDDWDYEVVKM